MQKKVRLLGGRGSEDNIHKHIRSTDQYKYRGVMLNKQGRNK